MGERPSEIPKDICPQCYKNKVDHAPDCTYDKQLEEGKKAEGITPEYEAKVNSGEITFEHQMEDIEDKMINELINPANNKIEEEINDIIKFFEAGNWDEILQRLTAEIPRELHDGLEDSQLSNIKKDSYKKRLSGIRRSIIRAENIPKNENQEFDKKNLIVDAINELIIKLS